jgi:hypothetical protein
MPEVICPYCNSLLPASAGLRACPRCGESLQAERDARSPQDMLVLPEERRRWGWLFLLLVIPLVVIGITLASLNHKKKASKPGDSTPAVVKPPDMPGLGYLPGSVELVMAIQLPQTLEKMGPDADKDPAATLERLGLPRTIVETIDRASGVGLKKIDQIVLGAGFEKSAFPPQLVVVVHTKQPYDIDAVAHEAKATGQKREGRTIYTVKGTPEIDWWSANDRILIATILPRDLEPVPLEPKAGIDHLRPEVAHLIREGISQDSCAWLVASSDDWAKHVKPYTWLPTSPLQGRDDLVAPAERFRSATMSISHAGDGDARIRVEFKNAEAAERYRGKLENRFRSEPIEVSGEAQTVTIRAVFEATLFGSILSRLVGQKE